MWWLLFLGMALALDSGEVQALEAMRKAWGKTAPGDWTPPPTCAWSGVECDGELHVTNLNLPGAGLEGEIPDEVGQLVHLQRMYLGYNDSTGATNSLGGQIPSSMGQLCGLVHLDLSSNSLAGSIPKEIGNLGNLGYLDLGTNQLSGSIPPEIGNLLNLFFLILSSNQLSGSIPKEIGSLVNLGFLDMFSNQLSGSIPKEIGNLGNLGYLDLDNNQLSGSIPKEIGNLVNLGFLDLDNNQLSGSIPKEIGSLTKLQWLILNSNQLSGSIPKEIGKLVNLGSLDLSSNQFNGSIPKEISNLVRLNQLNKLDGSLAPLVNLTSLIFLDVSDCWLSGGIPDEFGRFPSIAIISLASNSLSGPVPSTLMNSETLVALDVSSNKLTSLPSCGAVWNLALLSVANNSLEELPATMDACKELQSLDVSFNEQVSLSAAVLESLGRLQQLGSLDVSGTRTGPQLQLPHGGFRDLVELDVSNTSLEDLEAVCGLKIKALRAAATNITGTPQCFGGLDSLEALDLSHNNLSNTSAFVRLPVTLTSLRLANTSQTVFPSAVTALAYRCATVQCETAVRIDAPLSLLDLSDNPTLSSAQSEDVSVSELLYRNRTWNSYHGNWLTPVFTSLAYLDISKSYAQSFPESVFEKPLRVLFLNETSGIDVVGIVARKGQLETDHNHPVYNDNKHYRCDDLQLRGRQASQVVFEPKIYQFAFCQCQSGFYGYAPDNCSPCTDPMRKLQACRDDGALEVPHGFWAPSLNVTGVKEVLECVNEEACRPEHNATCRYDKHTGVLQCYNNGTVLLESGGLDVLCASGYRSRLCTRCDNSWFMAGEAECEECPSTAWWEYVIFSIAVILALLIFVFLQSFGAVAVVAEVLVVLAMVVFSVGEAWTMAVVVLVVLLATVSQAEAAEALVKSLLFFVQTLAAVAPRETWETLHRVWSPLESFGRLKFVNLHVQGAECVWPALAEPGAHLWFILGLPVVFVVVAGVVVGLGSGFRRTPPMRRAKAWYDGVWTRVRDVAAPKRLAERLLADDWELASDLGGEEPVADVPLERSSQMMTILSEVVQSSLFVIYAAYFEVVQHVLSVFRACDDYGYMTGGYSWLECTRYGGETTSLYVAGTVGVVVYVIGVALLLAGCLLIAGVMIRRKQREEASKWVGFLFEGYRRKVFWFELVWTARRLALAALLALVPATNASGPILILLVLGGSTVLQHFVRPFEGRLENGMEMVSLVSLTGTYAVRQILEPGALLGNDLEGWNARDFAIILVIVLNVLVVVAFVLALASDYLIAIYEVIMARLRPRPLKLKMDEPTIEELQEEMERLREEMDRMHEENSTLRRRNNNLE